jgi:Spx/MgsR family transcriptional regulator
MQRLWQAPDRRVVSVREIWSSVACGEQSDTRAMTMDTALALYGIPNCGTVKKARAWLEARGIDYAFHDYKKVGVPAEKLETWAQALGWEAVINRAGMTFRKLPDDAKAGLDASKAITLMVAQPSMIKRPIVEHAGGLLVGFKEAEWAKVFTPDR